MLAAIATDYVGTAALGCPVERSSSVLCAQEKSAEPCCAGQPRMAVPTRLLMALPHERGARAHINRKTL
jgi:hypothetical protein